MRFVATYVRRLCASIWAGVLFAVWKFEPSYGGGYEEF